MKNYLRKIASATVIAASAISLNAQELVDGDAISGDFTINELLNSQAAHTLSTYLDAGKTVFVDVSAVWCPPCWTFHETHALEALYEAHGPAGAPGVSAGTTDDVMAFLMMSDDGTVNQINGIGSGTEGDWTIGAAGGNGSLTVPILYGPGASTAADNVLTITGYPTIYKICPDRTVEVFNPGSSTAAQLYAKVGSCGGNITTASDARLLVHHTYTNSIGNYCGTPSVTVQMQNFGSNNLTSATLKAYEGSTEIGSFDWIGTLTPYSVEAVTINLAGMSGDNFTVSKVEISTTDDNTANNALVKNVSMTKGPVVSRTIGFDVLTDGYGEEFGFTIHSGIKATTVYDADFFSSWQAGGHVASMLNYYGTEYGSITSIADNTNWVQDITLPSDGCYTLKIRDDYGDGFYGTSGYAKVGSAGTILFESYGAQNQWFSEEAILFEADAAIGVGIEEAEVVSDFILYPNPATSTTNLKFNINGSHDATIKVVNSLGQAVYTESLFNIGGDQIVSISTVDLESGLYFVTLQVENDAITTQLSVIK